MITDLRRPIDEVAAAAGSEPGDIRTKMFRHTYCAARLQTLDRGTPYPFTQFPGSWGHASTAMVERVYGHLGQVVHRSEIVEYRIENHREKLAQRLVNLEEAA